MSQNLRSRTLTVVALFQRAVAAVAGSPSDPDALLADSCKSGDQTAFTMLYERYADHVFRHLTALLGSQAEAQDGVQLTFEQAAKRIHTFDGRSRFSTWLFGVATHVAMNIMRGRRRRLAFLARLVQRTQTVPAPASEARLAAREELRRLYVELDTLPAEHRAAFLLHYVAETSVEEIAVMMGATVSATRKRIQRTRARLLERMRSEPDAPEALGGAHG